MKLAPYRIERLVLDAARCQVRRSRVDCFEPGSPHAAKNYAKNIHVAGYVVTSTAPYSTDEKSDRQRDLDSSVLYTQLDYSVEQATRGIAAIAQDLHRIKSDPTIAEPPQLVIAVHGYNTSEADTKKWYHDVFSYVANDDREISQNRNLVFIGYRWSSKKMTTEPRQILTNLKALPDVPRALLSIGVLLIGLHFGNIVTEVLRSLDILQHPPISTRFLNFLFGDLDSWGTILAAAALIGLKSLMGIALVITIAMVVLGILRVSEYFRDVYRAINFAVPDLTELIRQIDKAVMDLDTTQMSRAYAVPIDELCQDPRPKHTVNRVNLSFLGHSMGGLVITNVVRILSDVFDKRSIEHIPTAEIGNTLRLSRLILASPDIPVLSVVSSRANGLASSLRRFDEAYLFSNEGDLALRLASTAANYISFPSANHYHGHRLGSIALRNDIYEEGTIKKGVVNLLTLKNKYSLDQTSTDQAFLDQTSLDQTSTDQISTDQTSKKKSLCEQPNKDPDNIFQWLFITRASGWRRKSICLSDLFKDEHDDFPSASLADLFTFVDCTDYQDYSLKLVASGMNKRSRTASGVLTRAHERPSYLNLKDYVELFFDMVTGKRDVHGGYFRGEYSRELIYRIAFLGFNGMLNAIAPESPSDKAPGNEASSDAAIPDNSPDNGQNKGSDNGLDNSPDNRSNNGHASIHSNGHAIKDPQQQLQAFHQTCQAKGLQVYLSPLRYRVDVQGAALATAREEMLLTVKAAEAKSLKDCAKTLEPVSQ